MRHVMAIADDALFARVKASASRAKRTVQGHVEVLLAQALGMEDVHGEGPPATPPVIRERPPVVETGTPDSAAVCRSCGHEARKHEPHCVMMGCACRKFR